MGKGKYSKEELGAMASKALANTSQAMMATDSNSYGAVLGRLAADQSDSAMMAATMDRQKREQEEAQKKEKKKGLFGSIGSTLGTIAGAALAPVTGGTSLAATAIGAGIGGAVGSAGGQALSGGGVDVGTAIQSGIMSGITTGIAPAVFGKLGLTGLTKLPASIQGLALQNFGGLLTGGGGGSLAGSLLQKDATTQLDPNAYQTGGQLTTSGYGY